MDVDALAALTGNALVTVAVTDGFETVRHRIARVFGRGKPDAAIERRLDATRQQLSTSAPEETERLRATLAGQWQTRLIDLLTDHPEAAAELHTLLAELRSHDTNAGGNVTNTMTGTVVNGPVIMGRDFGDISIDSPPRRTPGN